jgi:transcriptional regulator with XRE-family HTH domain
MARKTAAHPRQRRQRPGWTRGSDLLDLTGQLGAKLRDLRLSRGLSLKEASETCGVPQPTLSRIENNKMAPTIGLLSKIVAGLEAPWSAVLPESVVSDAPAGRPVSFSSQQMPEVRLGRRKAQALHPRNPLSSRLSSFILSTEHRTVKGGGGFLSHPHTELCFVLEGILRLHLKGRRARRLRPGESALFEASTPHAYTSETGQPARFLIVTIAARTPPA